VMPAPDQFAADYMLFGTSYQGNPDLDPETSATFEAGADVAHGPVQASLTLFHTEFEDKIVPTSAPGPVSTWENIGGAEIQGIEGSMSYDLGSHLPWAMEIRPYVNGVYLTRFEDEETGEDLLFTSELQLTTGLTLARGPDFLSFDLAYTGRQDVEDFESGVFPAPVVQKGGFAVAGLTLSKQIYERSGWGALSLRGEVGNLFDRDYAYVKGYPMPGRTFFLGLRGELY
ncbi:MAG: TonB-dependent receptor domain-containing protein, partial [Desulfohalobiaceae bacterium]